MDPSLTPNSWVIASMLKNCFIYFDLNAFKGKNLVIALIEEYKNMEKLNPKHKGFYDIIETIAYSYPNQKQLIFGWTSEITTINSIAIRSISPLPNLIVINATTLQYYLIERQLNAQNIITFLDDLIQMSPKLKASLRKTNILFIRILLLIAFRRR